MKTDKTFPEFNGNRRTLQVKTRLLPEELNRLDGIIKKYQFKSRYQLMQYLVRCFLKVADPKGDEFVPKDIEDMFDGYETASQGDFDGTKAKRDISGKRF